MSEENGKLPAGWRTAKLGDLLVEAVTGFACGQRATDGVVQLRMNNVTRRGELDWSSFIRVPVEKAMLDDYALRTGDVMFNNTNSTEMVGKTALFNDFDEAVVFSNHFTRLRAKPDALAPDFLALWLHTQWQAGLFARICDRWIGQSAVQRNKLLTLEIPLPPLEEQRRIAARLREGLSILAEARAALGSQLGDAESLPAAHLRAVFQSDMAKSWPRVALGEVCVDGGQYGTSEKSNTVTDGMPVLRMGNIFEGKILWKNLKYADRSNPDCAKYLLAAGDLLFNRTNSVELVGKSAVFDGEREAIFASYLIRFRMLPNRANPHFVCAFINSAQGRRFIEANMVRAIGQANVSASTMQRMEIPAPPIEEQNAIAARLQATYAETSALQQTIAVKLSELEELPAALSRAAFSCNGD